MTLYTQPNHKHSTAILMSISTQIQYKPPTQVDSLLKPKLLRLIKMLT